MEEPVDEFVGTDTVEVEEIAAVDLARKGKKVRTQQKATGRGDC